VLPDIFDKRHEDTQPGAADVREIAAVHHNVVPLGLQQALKGLFELRGGVRIQIALQLENLNAVAFPLGNFEISHRLFPP